MNYWLALWGGAAKWFAHIWVLKHLQEKNIEINEITWTSMWAIIGGCLAIWLKYEQIYQILENISFLKLIDLNLKSWIVRWDKVKNKLKEVFGEKTFQETQIPFKTIATHLQTWQKIVFQKGKLIDAIMASISIPGIFKPYLVKNNEYIDWGLKDNLPLNEIKNKNILAISVLGWEPKPIKFKRKIWNFEIAKTFIGCNHEILQKAINTITKTNEELHIKIAKNNWKNVILIEPNLSDYQLYDFYKYKEIINEGYLAIKKANIWN